MFHSLINKIKKNKFTVLITVFVIGLISITLGSALLNSVLTLTGNTKVKENSWNIHFEYIDNINASHPNTDSSLDARITDATSKKENISFTTNFQDVGDYYEFDVYTWNEGTLDAMLDESNPWEFNIPTEYKNNIKYELNYDDDDIKTTDTITYDTNKTKRIYDSRYDYSRTTIRNCDPLYKDTLRKIHVRVKYTKKIADLTTDKNINFNLKLNYVQLGPCSCQEQGTCPESEKHLLRIRPNGGKYDNKTTETKLYLEEGEEYTLKTPSRELYNFTGWEVISPTENGSYTITGNTFKMGHENVILQANWEQGDYVARIMNKYYSTIQDAFDDVDSKNWEDNTVWLLKDTTEYPVNTAQHAFIFNLDNHVVTGTIQNNKDSNITLINGIIKTEERLTAEQKEGKSLNKRHEAAVINYGKLNMGMDDPIVSIENSITLSGNEYGLLNFYDNGSKFNFYDGIIEGDTAIEAGYNKTPDGYYVFVDHNNTKNCQRAYLIPNPNRAVAKTTTKGTIYYYNMQDAINSVETYKNDNNNLTDNDYIITVTRDFEGAYPLTVSSQRIFINTDGKDISTGEAITNNGYLKIYNTDTNKSTISASASIKNNKNLVIDNVSITSTTDDDVIVNKANLTLSKTTITGNTGFGINNTGNGVISADDKTIIKANSTLGLYNNSDSLNIENASIYGLENNRTMTIGTNAKIYQGPNYLAILNFGNLNINDGTIVAEDEEHYIIENNASATLNINGGTVSNKYNAIRNRGTVNITDGNISSDNTTVVGSTINVRGGNISTVNGPGIDATDAYVYGGTISSTNGNAIDAKNATVYGGTVTSENAKGINSSNSVTVEGGNIHGATYGVYGNIVDIKNGQIDSDEIGVYAYIYYEYNIPHPGNTGMTGGKITARQLGIESDNFSMANGTVISEEGPGVTINQSGNITGGTIIGETYGVHNKGTLTIGKDDGTISQEEPLIIGKSYGLYANDNTITNFYDGILKGTIDGYTGVITGTPVGAIVTDGEDTIDDVHYETDYLISYKNWLRVGDNEFNTINAASSYIQENGNDGDTIEVFDNAPDLTFRQEFVEGNKTVNFDLAGFTLTTTQPIVNNGSNTKIIDTSNDNKGTIITKKNISIINNVDKNLIIDGGNYVGHTKYALQNDGNLTIENAKYNVDDTAICNRASLVINNINLNSTINGIENIANLKDGRTEVIISFGSITMNGGTIDASNYGIYSNTNYASKITINGGTITATKRGISIIEGGIEVNGGTITADEEYAIYNYKSNTVINDGTLKSDNNTAIFMAYPLTVNGGTITGKTYGVYTDQYCNAYAGSCGYPQIDVTGGHIIGQTKDGIRTLGSKLYVTGGIVEGKLDGINSNAETYIGSDEGSISKTSPVLIGHTKYALETTAYTGFFDGILKARINTDAGINDVYKGLISIIPTGSVITEDFEYINRVKYDTKYLDTKDNWLQIGDDESRRFNSLNAASAAMRDGDTTIKVIYSAYIDFKQEINTDKDVIFDLNGHSVILTQPIENKSKTTIIDSGENGYLNNIRDSVIINSKTLIYNSGSINSETGTAIVNNDSLTVNDGSITSEKTAISNSGTATINGGTITGNDTCITSSGILTVKDGEITTTGRYGIYVTSNDTTIDGGHIKGIKGINVSGGKLVVNAGTIDGTNESAISNESTTIVNGGIINASNSTAIRNIKNSLTINGGKITSLTNNGIDNEGIWYNPAILVVNDGEITGYTSGINNIYNESGYNNVTINGGKIVGQNSAGIRTNSITKILGGTLIGKTYGAYCENDYVDRYIQIGEDDGNINVDTPVLRGDLYGIYVTSTYLNFYDGILKGITERINDYEKIGKIPERAEIMFGEEDIDEKHYLTAYLYQEQDIARNLKTNKECTKQIKVEDGYCIYNNLQDAFDDATDGEIIQILSNARNVPIYYDVTNSKNITLDLNGKTITSTKNIINNGNLTITSSVTNKGTLKTSMNNYLLRNNDEMTLDNVYLINGTTSYNVVYSTGKLIINNSIINSKDGIYSQGELDINNSNVVATRTAITSRGKLTINKGTYNGGNYSIHSSTSSDANISDVTLSGILYNEGSNTATIENSVIMTGIQNYANMTILEGRAPTTVERGINNGGTLVVNHAVVKNGLSNSGNTTINNTTIQYGRITNSNILTVNDSTYNSMLDGYNSDNIDYALNNTGTATLNNMTFDLSASRYSAGIINSGTVNINENTYIYLKNGTFTYGIRNTNSGNVNISKGRIKIENALYAYGIYSTGENAKATMIEGTIDVNGTNTYGTYLKYGTFEMGVKEVGENSGTQYADVSLTNPLINSHGTNGIGVKKESGFFNYYDGKIWGSKYSKPEVASNIEYKWEATTYIDEESGYEYTILEYMPNDYLQEEVCLLRGVAYESVTDALARANNGDVIKLVRSTTESFEIPSGKNVIINLNKNTITGKITNNGTVNIYNGTLTNHEDSVLINNGTFVMGDSSDAISSANIRIVSDKNAVVNNGQFNMYDGYIEGNPSINGSINAIPPLSRIRTSNTGQSERKTLQSLDRDSIINGDTDLIITIDPNGGYYDERNVIQEIYLKHENSYDLMTNHTIRKNGCEFDGWEVSDPTAYNNGVITVDLSDITVKAKWRVKDTTVAQIGNDYFDTLADAIFHAKKGDKVILLKDTVEDITNDKNITIDLNEHKVTGALINTANLSIINGTIENTEENGIAIVNTKSLTIGILEDGVVSNDSVKIIGNTVGIQNDGMLNLYDGYIQGDIALNGRVDGTPRGYFLYTERVVQDTKIKQKVYLIGNPENAVAETRDGGLQYFFNLNDAIATSALTGYKIYIRKDFEATYDIEVPEEANVVIDFEGHTISTGNTITNNGNLKLMDSKEEKGSIQIGNTITNNGTLVIEEIKIDETNQTNKLIDSTGSLKIKDTTLTSINGNTVTCSGPLELDNIVITAQNAYAVYASNTLELKNNFELNSNNYALYNAGQELTINSGLIRGLETTKNVTIENGATITGNSNSGGVVIRDTATVTVNGGTITSGSTGVHSLGANSKIIVNGGTISAANALYCYGTDNNIIMNGGVINNSTNGVLLGSTKCNFEMNGGEITATQFGVADNSSYNTITINDGTITATNGDGIRENTSRSTGNNQVAFPRVYIKGGTITGSRYGMFCNYSHHFVTGGEIKSTGNYAVYISSWGVIQLKENGFINSPNSSAIYSDSCVNIYGGRVYSNGQYGVYNNYTCFEMTDGVIENASAGGYGIRVNGTNNISGGEIKASNIGILNNSSATVNIYGNTKISGDSYGISQTTNGTINIGRQADDYSIVSPYITGGLYGIYKSNGNINFYNGKLRGYTNGYNNSITGLRKNMDIYTTIEDMENTDSIKTYATTSVSSEAQSNSAKSGNGHARITYIGATTDSCTSGTVTDIEYSGHEDTFTASCAGEYKLEVWGASGGDAVSTNKGGYGGYATGNITLTQGEKLYINVGGAGKYVYGNRGKSAAGGYNGGGTGVSDPTSNYRYSGSGGGATHIATSSGLLSSLENNKSSIIIVAGGGAGSWSTGGTSNWETRIPGHGGGYKGFTGTGVSEGNPIKAAGGTQDSGYAFGQGAGNGLPGGGGGYYGGKTYSFTAGGGSGYIASDRLTDAYMYGYNVEPTGWVINYLVPKEAFLRVGDQTFNNFEDATAAIEETGTIYLLKNANVTDEAILPSGKNITIDLQGYTLSMTKAITNNGNLTIKDSSDDKTGELNNTASNTIINKGNLTIDGTKVNNTTSTAATIWGNAGNGTMTITNDAEVLSIAGTIAIQSNQTLNVESGLIKSTSGYGVRNYASGATTNVYDGKIEASSNNAILCDANNTNVNIYDGEIIGNFAIRANNTASIKVIDGTLRGTSHAIYANGSSSTINISNGTFSGGTTIYANSSTLTITNGTFTSTGDYIVNASSGTQTISGGTYDGSGNGFAVYNASISNVEINAGGTYGINSSGTITLTNTTINTTRNSSIGIYGKPNITFNNSNINSNNIAMQLSGGTININSGSITGKNNGIVSNGATINMGKSDTTLSIEKPYVSGGNYAIDNTSGTFNFYNGRLRGKIFGYSGDINNIRKGKQVYTEYEGDLTTIGATVSTDKVSEEPVSKYAKIGNGHARITYVGETNSACTNGDVTDISYTGHEDTFNVPCTGEYKLEVWGAQGGKAVMSGNIIDNFGYGGYSTGKIVLSQSDTLYINVGGQGETGNLSRCAAGGYNGGGHGTNDSGSCGSASDDEASGGGGGATHIATSSGLLSSLENNKDSIIIVAGGGGGGSYDYLTGSGGGFKGGINSGTNQNYATQDSGYAFGQGQDGAGAADSDGVAGAGGGWYGGYANNVSKKSSGTGGSGYTGHADLTNSIMYGYKVEPTDLYTINYLVDKDGFLEVDEEVYNSFEEAFAAITGNSGTIKVLNNNSVQEEVTIPEGKTITLDLNGKTINMSHVIVNNGNLTVTDSSGNNRGTITNGIENTVSNHGNLIIDGAIIDNTTSTYSAIPSYNGTITIKDKSVIRTSSTLAINITEDSIEPTIIKMEGGKIVSSGDGVQFNYNNSEFNMTGGKIEAENVGVNSNTSSNNKVSIKDAEISSTGNAIYVSASSNSNTITIDNSKLVSSDNSGIYIKGTSANVNINNSEVTGVNGFYLDAENADIKIVDSEITGTSGYGYADVKQKNSADNGSAYTKLNITDSKIVGTTHGMYVRYNRFTLDNTEVKTTSTSASNYALYTDGSTNYDIINNSFINAPNASGFYSYAKGNINSSKIYSGVINGNGIGGSWFEGQIYDSEIISVGGTGINSGSETKFNLEIKNSTIEGYNNGINLISSNTSNGSKILTILDSTIKGGNYGIYQSQNYITTIGSLDDSNNIKKPYIEGGTYGLYKTNGTVNFYSGRIKGGTEAYYGSINNIREGYEIYKEDSQIFGDGEGIKTISTTDVSDTPESNKAKSGAGHARITYLGNEESVIKISKEYDIPTDCSNYINKVYTFNSLNQEQKFIAKCKGTYKLEVWGAQGGNYSSTYPGGYGGYSTGTIDLNKNQKLFINVGGTGSSNYSKVAGGYNGGGNGTGGNCSGYRYSGSGGGATHIATSSGLLSSLENKKNSILIVAGGGGGSQEYTASIGAGASAGGYIGNTATWTNNGHRYYIQPTGGTQESGGLYGCSYNSCNQSVVGSFGQGGNFNSTNCSEGSGGGGGYYGGGSGSFTPGAGGSGFINNNSLNNKSMYCYGCQESNEDATKTISTIGDNESLDSVNCPNGYSSNAISKCAKAGAGVAKITLVDLDSTENKVFVRFISENGTITTNSKEIIKGNTIGTLETPITEDGIVFDGWYLDTNFTEQIDSSYIVNNSINVYAKFIRRRTTSACSVELNTVYDFNAINAEDSFEVPCTGSYKLEVWGAQGGTVKYGSRTTPGGYGGYSTGKIMLNKNTTLYINVGGAGASNASLGNNETQPGGYNGGGNSIKDRWGIGASSGGATHIATSSGLLSSLENNKKSILIVAGGGAGGGDENGSRYTQGGSGGGYIGASGSHPSNVTDNAGSGGTQKSGYAFGHGASNTGWYGTSGAGWYGGTNGAGGGGGSGYIGNNNLYDKVMYGYNVPSIYSDVPKVVWLVKTGEVIENTTTNAKYENLQEALDAANSGDTLKLLKNASNSVDVTTNATGVTIDLDGHEFNIMNSLVNNGNITITNSKTTGKIITPLSTSIISNSGTLNISNIRVESDEFITNTGSLSITDCTITSSIGIRNNDDNASLNMNDSTITSSNQAIINNGAMTINNSSITGDNYAIYDSGTSESTIIDSTISSSSTSIYNYSTAKIVTTKTNLSGNINNTKSNGTINIVGDTTNNNNYNSVGTITNSGNMLIKRMNVNYSSDYSGQDQLITNSGSLTIMNSNVTYENTYSNTYNASNSNQGSVLLRNTGSLTSTNNNYKIFNQNKKLTKHLTVMNINGGIVNLTDDKLKIINGYSQVGINTNGSHTTTLNNTDIEIESTYARTGGVTYAIDNQASTMSIIGGNMTTTNAYDARAIFTTGKLNTTGVHYNISGSHTTYIYTANISNQNDLLTTNNDVGTVTGENTSVFSIANGTIDITNGDYTATATNTVYGVNMTTGTTSIKSGTFKLNGSTARGVNTSDGTIIIGENDTENQTGTADVSTTNPHIEAIGTTSGIGVSLGNARFEYYDGIIIGSTSARVTGEYVHATQHDFITKTQDYIVDGVRQYEYCILEYSK